MNPKDNNLDPKLKETYERIMGTSVPSATPQAQDPAAVPQAPQQQMVSQELPPPPPVQPQTVLTASSLPNNNPQPLPAADAASEMVQSPQVFKAGGDPFAAAAPPPAEVLAKNAVVNPTAKKGNKLMPIILGVGGTIFFVAYGVIWAKVFGLF